MHPAVVRSALGTDSGLVVLGWLTRVAVGLLLTGLVLFDAVAVGAAHLSTSDDANAAAEAANATWNDTRGNVQMAYNAAANYAEAHNAAVVQGSFRIFHDGRVELRLQRDATTVLVGHIGPLRHYAVVQSWGTATTPVE